MRRHLEQDLIKPCLQYLALVGVWAWRNNTGAIVGEYKGHRRFVRFGMKGASDILGVLPAPRRGHLLAVELKRPGNKVTPDQRAFLDEVAARGGLALVCYSLVELEAALRSEGIAP